MAQVFLSFEGRERRRTDAAGAGLRFTRASRRRGWAKRRRRQIPSFSKIKRRSPTKSTTPSTTKRPQRPRPRPSRSLLPRPESRAPRARVSAPEPEPAPAPAPAPPARDLPALETLKSVVTTAVRLAQKGEGSKKILELLPAFKDTTGLDFVMNAEDKHRAPLYDLVLAADLPVV